MTLAVTAHEILHRLLVLPNRSQHTDGASCVCVSGWRKVAIMAKALPRSASGMPFYQTKRLVARVLEDKVLANAKCVTAAEVRFNSILIRFNSTLIRH